jgi:histidine ammonia-lyase
MKSIVINGNDLNIISIVEVGLGKAKVELDITAVKRCYISRQFLEKRVESRDIIYGVNTSYGPMCNKIIRGDKLGELQINLIRSHAAGLGDPIETNIARAILLVRLNTLLKGYSGVRVELLEHMRDMINHGLIPYIPECGSVGASGDLVHLAHMALSIIGEGKIYFRDKWYKAEEAYKLAELTPYKLGFKEGIGLINGTSAMTAIAAFAVKNSQDLLNVSCMSATFALEIFGGIDDALDEDLHQLKPHPGQIAIAKQIRDLICGSKNIVKRDDIHEIVRKDETSHEVFETITVVQDAYSMRCTAQILAPVKEIIDYVKEVVGCEANSVNDNPVILADKHKIIHGGNFHGQSIACAMDMLCIVSSTMCTLSERRLNKLLDKNLNLGLPENLIMGVNGLNMGLMGVQYLATSTTAENRQLANPVSTLSISCNASNQDVVSMGTIAARKAYTSTNNAKHVLTVEILADLQALCFRNADTMGVAITKIHQILSERFKCYDNNRILHNDLVNLRECLFDQRLFEDLACYC